MNWTDIAMLLFSCTAVNHMGLIDAAESVLGRKLPVLNCPKCLTFWSVLFFTTCAGWNIIGALAVSFFCAWLAVWLELGMGFIDTLYIIAYEKVYSTTDTGDEIASDADNGNSEGALSNVRKINK